MERRDNFVKYIGIIELENGDYFEVCRVASEGKYYLEAGTFTNTCFLTNYGIDYDETETLDENLTRLYDYVVETREADAMAWKDFEAEAY